MDMSDARPGGTELGQIWITAVRNYEQKTGKKLFADAENGKRLGVDDAENTDQIKAGLGNVLDKFKRHRQDPAKKDALSTKLKDCAGKSISTIQKILQGIEVLGDAASAFPPAMPASLIFSALDHVLDTFQRVTADYDKLESFFTNSQRFLEQLSLLEDKPQPSPVPLQKCVERIFSAHLDMCAVAQKFQKDGKFETWAKDLWRGKDPDIKEAYSSMDDALAEFSRTLNISTYSRVLDTYEELHVFRLEITTKIEEVDHKLDIAAESHVTITREVHEFHQEMSQKEDHVLAGVQDMTSKVDKLATLFLRGKAKPSDESKPRKDDKGPRPGDFVDKRAAAISQIEGHFERGGFVNWEDTRTENDNLQSDIQDTWMQGTSSWFLDDEPAFQSWVNDDPSVLFITGGDGTGKSFLCFAALQKLLRQTQGDRHERNVASYFFQSDLESQISPANGLACAAWQASNLDNKYSEEVAAAIRRDIQNPEFKIDDLIEDTWNRFFAVPYSAPGRSLYLFLDALDEASDDERGNLIRQLALIKEKRLNIRLFITGRADIRSELEALNPTTIELTPKRLSADISTVIKTHLKSLPRLQSMSRKLKSQILQKVRAKADGESAFHHLTPKKYMEPKY
jgi:fungal STAND N-terminal Goodbye domain